MKYAYINFHKFIIPTGLYLLQKRPATLWPLIDSKNGEEFLRAHRNIANNKFFGGED